MRSLSVLLASAYVPRHDGLATFAADLERGLTAQPGVRVHVIAIDPEGETIRYGRKVVGRIQQGDRDSYRRAAELVQRTRPDVVSIQHEFGLWGSWDEGLDEDYTQDFIDAISSGPRPTPVVTTLHTIRPTPSEVERDVLRGIVEKSAATVVMARAGAMILVEDYGISPNTLVHIPHGVPVVRRLPRRQFKRELGLGDRTIISTIGLLDPRKGIEYAIRAMQPVVENHPKALYLVAGETHPSYRAKHGEQYRNELRALVKELDLSGCVRFVNQYLSDKEIVDYLQASDIYLTPYLDRNQITSGTLAFAVGTGKAVISTPYIHATEALAEGRGLLAEFRSSESIAQCLLLLLDDPEYRRGMEQRMAEYGSQDAWPLIGARYVELFQRVVAGESLEDVLAIEPEAVPSTS
ncbi:MAG TPA: glycosyltransferase family 4 protein [Chloroflexota bacterium]